MHALLNHLLDVGELFTETAHECETDKSIVHAHESVKNWEPGSSNKPGCTLRGTIEFPFHWKTKLFNSCKCNQAIQTSCTPTNCLVNCGMNNSSLSHCKNKQHGQPLLQLCTSRTIMHIPDAVTLSNNAPCRHSQSYRWKEHEHQL